MELGIALRDFGFNLEPRTVHLIMAKHASVDLRSGITFDRFIRACVVVKSLTEGFQRFDPNRKGFGCMSYRDFLETCTSCQNGLWAGTYVCDDRHAGPVKLQDSTNH